MTKVLIVATSGPDTPKRCSPPFAFALEAKKMGLDVNICFVGQGPLMLKQGVAETVYPIEGNRPLKKLILTTLEAGVTFSVCAAALPLNDMTPDDLIEEIDELVGPSYLITEGLKADLVLNF